MIASLMLSQGVPMLLFGDECRRTQQGNNNAYCQDNAISWFDWRLIKKNEPLVRFCRSVIEFRRAEPTSRRTDFLTGQPIRPGSLPDASWYDPWGAPIDWSNGGHSLMCIFGAAPRRDVLDPPNHHLMILLHAGGSPQKFVIPKIARAVSWWLFLNTAVPSPQDVYPRLDGPPPPLDWTVDMESRSMMCYIARDEQ